MTDKVKNEDIDRRMVVRIRRSLRSWAYLQRNDKLDRGMRRKYDHDFLESLWMSWPGSGYQVVEVMNVPMLHPAFSTGPAPWLFRRRLRSSPPDSDDRT